VSGPQFRTDVAELIRQFDDFKLLMKLGAAAAEQLKKDHADPKASAVYGKYLCLVRGNWEQGLLYLAKGDDAQLKAVAAADIARPMALDQQLAVADRWWQLGEASSAESKPLCMARALTWYMRVAPSLTGVTRTRVDKRLESLRLILYTTPLAQPGSL
jgi:hypothetical protein